jgi:hypothetical protein
MITITELGGSPQLTNTNHTILYEQVQKNSKTSFFISLHISTKNILKNWFWRFLIARNSEKKILKTARFLYLNFNV